MTHAARRALLVMLLSLPVHATAQSETPWSGASLGVDLGELSSHACSAWASPLSRQICSTGGHFTGGVQLGENFQFKRVLWGFGLDLDTASSKNPTLSVKAAGDTQPAGIYTFSGRQTPNGFAIAAPRLGYAGDLWQPYLRAGALIASGAGKSSIAFTPAGAKMPNVSFDGETILDSDDMLDLKRIPRHLVVVGATVIGIEYATIFSALDVQVTVLEPCHSFASANAGRRLKLKEG